MLRLFSSIIGTVISSICISFIPILLLGSFSQRRGKGLRRFFKIPYYLYASLFSWLNPYVQTYLGFNLLDRMPRMIASSSLSYGIGWIIFRILHLPLGFWVSVVFIAHGLFVGAQWDRIEKTEDFQMGVRVDE